MNDSDIQAAEFAILCDPEGKVEKIIRDPSGLFKGNPPGVAFFSKISASDLGKLLNFFLEIKNHGIGIADRIGINYPDKTVLQTLFGGMIGESIGIAGASATWDAKRLFEELSGSQSPAVESKPVEVNEGYYFDELMRLNNELINTQRELAKKNRELAELNKMKNQFLGIAAHDLRSPLGVIIGYSDLILEDASMREDVRNNLIRRIYETGNFMLGLINDLLDVTSIESGTLELKLAEEELDSVIRHNIEMNLIYAKSKNITIQYLPPRCSCKVKIDRSKIDQAVTNYLTNAIKFSHPRSTVEVEIHSEPPFARVTVRDYGQGIREEELGNLFKPFQKTSTRSTTGEKSTGLGLAIVKKIIEFHGGKVGVSSRFGEGSEFYFTLPANDVTGYEA